MEDVGRSTRLTARMQVLGAALLFSTGGAAIKACSLGAWQVASFRSLLAGVVLWFVIDGRERVWRPREMAVGVAYAVTMLCYVGANKTTTAANAIFLQSTAPMYLLILGPWLLRESIRRIDLVVTTAIAIGLVLFFVGGDPPQATAPDPALGNVLGAVAGVSWAVTLLGLRWLGRAESTSGASAGASVVAGNLIAGLVALPFAFPVGPADGSDWAVIGYLGLFQIGLAYVWLTKGVRHVAALQVSLLLLLEPVANAGWAWLIHGEHPGRWSLVGGALILAATLISTLVRRR